MKKIFFFWRCEKGEKLLKCSYKIEKKFIIYVYLFISINIVKMYFYRCFLNIEGDGVGVDKGNCYNEESCC